MRSDFFVLHNIEKMKKIIIKEEDFKYEEFVEWNKTVEVVYYEHDYEKKIYIIKYVEK